MGREIDEAMKVLGLSLGSDRQAAARAYRRLARATHPDVSPDPDAADRFAAVAAAYRLVRGAPHPGRPPQPPPEASPAQTAAFRQRPPLVAGPVVVHRVQPEARRSWDG